MPETFSKTLGQDGKPVVKLTHTVERLVSKSDLEQERAALLQEIENMQARVRKIEDMLAMLE